jgi:ABC-type transport system involved in multi-copper enzyme maturation permease subunit
MVLLPLITRELSLRSRRAGSYWARLAVGGVAVLACVPILLSSGIYGGPGRGGSGLFDTLVALAFVLCCVACILSADVIASEKREGTLGLLFLTSVRQFDVVLAKLVSSGAAALTAMLVLLPFLALPMLEGGITGGETFRKGLALLNTLFLALAVGIYASACRQQRFKASRLAGLILFALTIFPLLGYLWWPFGTRWPWVLNFSPLATVIEAGDSNYGSSPWYQYWVGIVFGQVTAWLFLLAAAKRMTRMQSDEEVPKIVHVPPRMKAAVENEESFFQWFVRPRCT